MVPDLSIYISAEIAKRLVTAADLATAAQRQVQRIQTRTSSEVDSDGAPWPPYAPNFERKGIVTLGDLAWSIETEVDSHDPGRYHRIPTEPAPQMISVAQPILAALNAAPGRHLVWIRRRPVRGRRRGRHRRHLHRLQRHKQELLPDLAPTGSTTLPAGFPLPVLSLYTTQTQNVHEQMSAAFSGPVDIGLTSFGAAPSPVNHGNFAIGFTAR